MPLPGHVFGSRHRCRQLCNEFIHFASILWFHLSDSTWGYMEVALMRKILRAGGSRRSIDCLGETQCGSFKHLISCDSLSLFIRDPSLEAWFDPTHVEIERQIQLHCTPNWNGKKRHIIFYNYSIYIIIDHYSIQQIVGSCQGPHLSNSPSISLYPWHVYLRAIWTNIVPPFLEVLRQFLHVRSYLEVWRGHFHVFHFQQKEVVNHSSIEIITPDYCPSLTFQN